MKFILPLLGDLLQVLHFILVIGVDRNIVDQIFSSFQFMIIKISSCHVSFVSFLDLLRIQLLCFCLGIFSRGVFSNRSGQSISFQPFALQLMSFDCVCFGGRGFLLYGLGGKLEIEGNFGIVLGTKCGISAAQPQHVRIIMLKIN